jgi:hypothetical protein
VEACSPPAGAADGGASPPAAPRSRLTAQQRRRQAERLVRFMRGSDRKRLTRAKLIFKFITGHYMVDLYLTSHENIKSAFSTLGVVCTLLLAVGLTLFLAPLQGDQWLGMRKTQIALAICSGWAMLYNLISILLSLAILSFVSRIPEENGVLAAFVQAHRFFFTAPIMLAGSSVCVLLIAFVACAYAVYGPYVALLGFSSVLFWLVWLAAVSLRMLDTVWHNDYSSAGGDAEEEAEAEAPRTEAGASAGAEAARGGGAAAPAAAPREKRGKRRRPEGERGRRDEGRRRGAGEAGQPAGDGAV